MIEEQDILKFDPEREAEIRKRIAQPEERGYDRTYLALFRDNRGEIYCDREAHYLDIIGETLGRLDQQDRLVFESIADKWLKQPASPFAHLGYCFLRVERCLCFKWAPILQTLSAEFDPSANERRSFALTTGFERQTLCRI